jgi:glycosyltransferase involved in cell wall biosynthesis
MIKNLPVDIKYKISLKNTRNEYIKELPDIQINKLLKINFRGKWRLLNIQNKINSIINIRQNDFDIYHQTHYDPYAFKYLSSIKKSVTTIYDMNFFVIPEIYKDYPCPWLFKWQEESAKSADKIIAVSKNTKNNLMSIWKIPDKKIDVIYLGIENINLDDYDLSRKYEKPYLLFVGTRLLYKNFENYLKAFKLILEKNNDLLLVCTGYSFTKDEKHLLEELHLDNKVDIISADERTMVNLYRNAELFVYPSLYEGFGIPLLEAMSCQCPIICSNTSCFPEISGDAAFYFDPYSLENMVEATLEVLNNSSLKQKLVENGLERIKEFSWKTCADKHAALYKAL